MSEHEKLELLQSILEKKWQEYFENESCAYPPELTDELLRYVRMAYKSGFSDGMLLLTT